MKKLKKPIIRRCKCLTSVFGQRNLFSSWCFNYYLRSEYNKIELSYCHDSEYNYCLLNNRYDSFVF